MQYHCNPFRNYINLMLCENHVEVIIPSTSNAARATVVTAAGMCAGAGQSRTHLRARSVHTTVSTYTINSSLGRAAAELVTHYSPIIGPVFLVKTRSRTNTSFEGLFVLVFNI